MKAYRVGWLLLAAGLLVSLALTEVAQAEEAVLLRYKFAPGQVWAYDLNVTGGGRIEISGMPLVGEVSFPLSMIINMPLEVITREVDAEGNGRLSLRLERLGMQVTAREETTQAVVDFDQGEIRAKGETIPFPNVQMGAALQDLSFVMSPRGKVLKVEGFEEFMELLASSGMPGGFMGPKDASQWQQMLEAYPAQLPEQPVAVGYSWEQTVSIPMMFGPQQGELPSAETTVRYTLEKLGEIGGDRVARIGLDGTMEMSNVEMPMPGREGAGTPAMLDLLSMAMTGQLYLNLDAGYVYSARLRVTLNMDMSVGRGEVEGEEQEEGVHFALRDLRLFYNVNPR